MQLTSDQIQQLFDIIDYYSIQTVAFNVGSNNLTKVDKRVLERFGVNVSGLSEYGNIDTAYKFGILSTLLRESENKVLIFDDLKSAVSSGSFLPLNAVERFALDSIKQRTYGDIRGLGNRMKNNFNTILIEQDVKQRRAYEKLIKKETTQAIINRKNIKELVSELGHTTGDWARDFGRIADYNLHLAYDHGRAAGIKKEYPKSKVYKDVFPGACKHCIRLYLTKGIGSEPKAFDLDTLLSNGTNIGIKPIDWKPVIGPTHPFCRCQVHRIPEGMIWDDETKGFTKTDPNWKPTVQRKSKAKLRVGSKTYLV